MSIASNSLALLASLAVKNVTLQSSWAFHSNAWLQGFLQLEWGYRQSNGEPRASPHFIERTNYELGNYFTLFHPRLIDRLATQWAQA